nr:hypothetical protein SEVIR_3G252050v2 [Setaria viridis]
MFVLLHLHLVLSYKLLTNQCLAVNLWSFTVLKQSALCFGTLQYNGARLPGNSTFKLRSMACKALVNQKEL